MSKLKKRSEVTFNYDGLNRTMPLKDVDFGEYFLYDGYLYILLDGGEIVSLNQGFNPFIEEDLTPDVLVEPVDVEISIFRK